MAECPPTPINRTRTGANTGSLRAAKNGKKPINRPRNRGTGAGGAKTTKNGNTFELLSAHAAALHHHAFVPITFVHADRTYAGLRRTIAGGHITMVHQYAALAYMKNTFGIDIEYRPDELYIVDTGTGQYGFKVLEKKAQHTTGSVIDKLEIGYTRREIYRRILGSRFRVYFAWCLNDFLKTEMLKPSPKHVHFRDILAEQDIPVMYGCDSTYPAQLHRWIFSGL